MESFNLIAHAIRGLIDSFGIGFGAFLMRDRVEMNSMSFRNLVNAEEAHVVCVLHDILLGLRIISSGAPATGSWGNSPKTGELSSGLSCECLGPECELRSLGGI